MSYPGLVFIHFQCAVHKLQEVRGGYQIIFQYNGASVCIDLCGNSVNNTSCQTIVLFTFYDVYLLNPLTEWIKLRTSFTDLQSSGLRAASE